MTKHKHLAFPLAAIAAALLSVYGPAHAQDDEIKLLTTPESSVTLGIGATSDDAPRFGQYTGLHEEGVYGLADVNVVKRNDATGTWFKVQGRNLGLESRDLRISHERQGDWGYYVDYSEIPRFEPLRIDTSLTGIGTTTQVHGTALAPRTPVQLKTKRKGLGLGFDKQLGGGFDVRLSARSENKDGSRLWGQNFGHFLTEPIDSTINQFEGAIGFTGEKLSLSAGYYGSTYKNEHQAVTVTGPAGLVSLAPDNEAHQLYLSGGYAITPTTRSTFKVSRTRATQNETFFAATPLLAGAPDSLDGRVDTTLVQMGITSRPMPKLSLLANLRYEDRDDKTPRLQRVSAAGSRDGFNVPLSREQLSGKVEASYQLPMALRLTGGVDIEKIKRSVAPTLRQVSWREENDETSYRVELRRSLSETLNGSISYIHSDRDGSPYLEANNNAAADVIDPIHWADRKRDKIRLMMDWAPMEALSLQFVLADSRDKYDGRPLGPDRGKARLYSVDAAYTLSDEWQATAWISRDDNRMTQSTIAGAVTWQADLRSTGNAVGFGVRGQPLERLQVGADLQYQRDTDEYRLSPVASLPDVHYRTTALKLFGTYALRKNASVRIDYVYDHRRTDDWTWTDWTYAAASNDTTVRQDPNQKVHFLGVSYIYRF